MYLSRLYYAYRSTCVKGPERSPEITLPFSYVEHAVRCQLRSNLVSASFLCWQSDDELCAYPRWHAFLFRPMTILGANEATY